MATLSMRLFVLIALITLAGLGLLSWLVVVLHTTDLEHEAVQGALRLSDTLQRSMRGSMLENRKQLVYGMINAVGSQPGIEDLRIYNKEGRITFSSVPGERGQSVDMAVEACTHCHQEAEPISHPNTTELTRIFRGADGHRILGLITPIYNEQDCAGAACHLNPGEQQVLGVIDLQLSLDGIDRNLAAQNRRFQLLVYVLIMLIASVCGLFVWRFVHVPVKALIRGTERVGAGHLDHRIGLRSRSEIGRLARSFDQMAEELAHARRELNDWTRTLELRVEEKTRTLQQAQALLVHNEKMASLGALAAVVAHEINNPLSGVLTYTKLVRKILGNGGPPPERLEDLHQYLETMEKETTRCGSIVTNLLEFSRQSGTVAQEANLNDLLERTLFLIRHKLDLQGIELVTELSQLPPIVCDADQIQQAMLAVLINAIEAMPEGGRLGVITRVNAEDGERNIELEISDSGVGIPDEVLPYLFEPFYTTKHDKKGVGLGLSVVHGIIRGHSGRIDVRTQVDRGTTFVFSLPERSELKVDLLTGETDSDE